MKPAFGKHFGISAQSSYALQSSNLNDENVLPTIWSVLFQTYGKWSWLALYGSRGYHMKFYGSL